MKRALSLVSLVLMVGFVNFTTPMVYAAPGDKCDTATPCPAGEVCNPTTNVCETAPAAPALKKADGEPCADNSECLNGLCNLIGGKAVCASLPGKPATVTAGPAATAPAVDLCSLLPFSSAADPTYGCYLAALADYSMPGTIPGVRAKLDKMSPNAFKNYLSRLEKIIRSFTWLIYDYEVSMAVMTANPTVDPATIDFKSVLFNPKASLYWGNDEVATFLKGGMTKADGIGIGRSSLPHSGGAKKK